jgi:hypothetical protein
VAIRVGVVLVCDAQRTRGCHGRYGIALGPGVLPGAEHRARLEAGSTGWTREAGGKRDACPACSGARLEALLRGAPGPATAPAPP